MYEVAFESTPRMETRDLPDLRPQKGLHFHRLPVRIGNDRVGEVHARFTDHHLTIIWSTDTNRLRLTQSIELARLGPRGGLFVCPDCSRPRTQLVMAQRGETPGSKNYSFSCQYCAGLERISRLDSQHRRAVQTGGSMTSRLLQGSRPMPANPPGDGADHYPVTDPLIEFPRSGANKSLSFMGPAPENQSPYESLPEVRERLLTILRRSVELR
jgi:hypothetical protein